MKMVLLSWRVEYLYLSMHAVTCWLEEECRTEKSVVGDPALFINTVTCRSAS